MLKAWSSLSRSAKSYWGLVAALVLLGVFLRSLGYFDGKNGLWNDEANWVVRMARGISGGNIRPPGYVFVNKLLIDWYPSEAVLRSSSWLAGILSLPLFVVVARSAGLAQRTTLLGLFLLAVHPWAVVYAKEWKPYGLELGVHFAVLAAAFRYLKSQKSSDFWGLVLLSGLSLLFAWNIIFLFPGIWLASLVTQYRSKNWSQLIVSAGAVVVGAVGIGAMHWPRLVRLMNGGGGGERFWGKKYGVFYLKKEDLGGKLAWVWDKTVEVAGLPLRMHLPWDESGSVVQGAQLLFSVLVVIGVVLLLWKKQWQHLLLWLSPWLVTILANWLRVWPYGVFRTNVYLLVYPLYLGLWSLSTLEHRFEAWRARAASGGKEMRSQWLASACAILLALPFTPYDLQYFTYKDVATGAFSSSIGASLELIREREANTKGKIRLVLDGYACGTVNYYTRYHPTYKSLLPFVQKRLSIQCVNNSVSRLKKKIKESKQRPLWVITARPATREPVNQFLRKHCAELFSPELPTPDTVSHCRPNR